LNLGDHDLFETWRLLLGVACSIYAAIVTARSLWGWFVYLSAPDRLTSVMRRYVMVQLLRLRIGRFAFEFAQIAFWLGCLLFVLRLHRA